MGKRRRQQRFSAAATRTCLALNALSRALWNAFCGWSACGPGGVVLHAPVPPPTDTRREPAISRRSRPDPTHQLIAAVSRPRVKANGTLASIAASGTEYNIEIDEDTAGSLDCQRLVMRPCCQSCPTGFLDAIAARGAHAVIPPRNMPNPESRASTGTIRQE